MRSKARARLAQLRRGSRDLSSYRGRTADFVADVLGEHLWSIQRLVCESVRVNRRTAVASAHGVGKSFLAARVVCAHLSTHTVGDAFAVTTAPTFRQVRGILWREINRAHAKGSLPGRVNLDEWYLGRELVGFGRKPSDKDMTGFQGIHQRYVLVAIDEACGVPPAIWEAADTLLTNDDARILAIGNPDDPASHFAEVCRPGSGWNVIHISAFDTPNFTGEGVPDQLRPLLVGSTWVEEKRKSWGEQSPFWQSKVLGQFPENTIDTLISPALVTRAQNAELEPIGPTELGVDVARFGTNSTILMLRRGPVARTVGQCVGQDLMVVTGMVVRAIRDYRPSRIKIDDIGLGGGVSDRLNEIVSEERAKERDRHLEQIAAYKAGGPEPDPLYWENLEVVRVNVALPAVDKEANERFKNIRSEAYWALRVLFQDGDIDIDPDDDVLAHELCSIKYKPNSQGEMLIESKDDMAKRLSGSNNVDQSKSPDRADALMLAFLGLAKKPKTQEGLMEFYRRQANAAKAAKAERERAA